MSEKVYRSIVVKMLEPHKCLVRVDLGAFEYSQEVGMSFRDAQEYSLKVYDAMRLLISEEGLSNSSKELDPTIILQELTPVKYLIGVDYGLYTFTKEVEMSLDEAQDFSKAVYKALVSLVSTGCFGKANKFWRNVNEGA